MNERTIETGQLSDIPQLLELWEAAGSPPAAGADAPGVEALLAHDPGALLLARADGAVVGSLIAAWDGWRGSFYRLAVHPTHRRRGLATALLRAGEQRLARLGAVRLTAIAIAGESVATGFWEAAGYDRQANRARFVRMLAP